VGRNKFVYTCFCARVQGITVCDISYFQRCDEFEISWQMGDGKIVQLCIVFGYDRESGCYCFGVIFWNGGQGFA
jgi:hypothetical protein